MKKDESFLTTTEKEYLEGIMYKISEITNISVEQIKDTPRISEEVTTARQLYFYAAKRLRPFVLSSTKIGALVDKDHATVLHGIKKINEAIEIKYKPVMEQLKILNIIRTTYSEYRLVWEMPKLTTLLIENKTMDVNIILERIEEF